MLDYDLAELYEVPTRALNQAVKRNRERFPDDFMFQLTSEEFKILGSQIVISSWGGTRYPPFAFTELGVAMLSSVLRSEKAIQTNIAIMRAFVALQQYGHNFAGLTEKVLAHDQALADINEVLKWLGEENQARSDEIADLQSENRPTGDWENRAWIGFKK